MRTKRPDARPLATASLETYMHRPPDLVPVEITNNTVTEVAGRLSGGAGPGGTDSVSLQHWLLRFGAASMELRLIVSDFAEWLGNGRHSWYAYCAMMSVRMIALDKQPGASPVGVGETWRWLMAKCVLQVTGQEAKAACGTEHLASGVKSWIEGSIHAMILLWAHHYQEEEWGFLLIDGQNAFNEENLTEMLWSVWNEWPSGAQFNFN